MDISQHPISRIQWIPVDELSANDYNPNFVLTKELELLKFSLLAQGWIQPILVTQDKVVIDGFHRSSLCRTDNQVREMTGGLVPCCVMELTEPDRMMLTVRINRAKGVHSAVKMHEMVSKLFHEHKLTIKQICAGLGATKDEVDLLLKENVFKKLEVEKHEYSRAWEPKTKEELKALK